MRHRWFVQYTTGGQQFWRCTNPGCKVWKDNYQHIHGSWETRYHAEGMTHVNRAPPCPTPAPAVSHSNAPGS